MLLYACLSVCACVLYIVLIKPLAAIHNKWCTYVCKHQSHVLRRQRDFDAVRYCAEPATKISKSEDIFATSTGLSRVQHGTWHCWGKYCLGCSVDKNSATNMAQLAVCSITERSVVCYFRRKTKYIACSNSVKFYKSDKHFYIGPIMARRKHSRRARAPDCWT